jgi:hypothetical protein
VAVIGSAFRTITSAQCQRQRRMHVRRLARQFIFIVSTKKKVEGDSNE